MAGGGAALLSSWWPRRALAQAATDPALKVEAEVELDALARTQPHLHLICTDALAQLKYSFVIAASGKHPGTGNDFVELSRSFVAGRKPRTKAAYEAGARALLDAPPATREAHFGRYAKRAPAAFASAKPEPPPRPAKPATLEDLRSFSTPSSSMTDRPDAESPGKRARDKDLADGKKWKQVEFYISEVRCIENTGGLFEGTDEIAMGGVGVGATGGTERIKQFHVKDGFSPDKGSNIKKYEHGKRFAVFDVHPEAAFPHEYVVTLAMAELDDGGFGDFLEKLWKKVKGYVVAALAAAGGALAGALSLSWIPGIGTAIGAIIGAFIGWLVSLFHNDDDIVGHQTRALRLYQATGSYYDKHELTTAKGIPVTMDFKDAGHYRVTGGWRLVA